MVHNKKALLIIMLLTISLACSVSKSEPKDSQDSQDSTPVDAQSQSQAADIPSMDYNVVIQTEAISPENFLSLAKNYSYIDTTTGLSRTFVILENNSTDPLDIIENYTGKMTWFDENNQVIDEIDVVGFGTNIFPQEKQRFQSYPDPNKVNGRKISLVRFELAEVVTVKSYANNEFKDRISKQNWSHPFVSTTEKAFRLEPYLTTYVMGFSKVTAQNNTNANIKITVVGLYYNEKNELVGVGASEKFDLAALGSAEVDVATGSLSSEPVRIEYFAEMDSYVGVTEMMDILYP
jgi:hypothetical protein